MMVKPPCENIQPLSLELLIPNFHQSDTSNQSDRERRISISGFHYIRGNTIDLLSDVLRSKDSGVFRRRESLSRYPIDERHVYLDMLARDFTITKDFIDLFIDRYSKLLSKLKSIFRKLV